MRLFGLLAYWWVFAVIFSIGLLVLLWFALHIFFMLLPVILVVVLVVFLFRYLDRLKK